MNATNPPTHRPAAFDARVLAYAPGLRSLAYKLGHRGEAAEDLVTDTIIDALHRWRSYREDGGLWRWLELMMLPRSREARRRVAKEKEVRVDIGDGAELVMGVGPTQECSADLSSAVVKLSGRRGRVLLRRAMGEDLQEIGKELGISCERVRQIEEAARTALRCGFDVEADISGGRKTIRATVDSREFVVSFAEDGAPKAVKERKFITDEKGGRYVNVPYWHRSRKPFSAVSIAGRAVASAMAQRAAAHA